MRRLSPFAGTLADPVDLLDVSRLLQAYDSEQPDPSVPSQRVRFGTSGHRGSSVDRAFNRNHILAITQAICFYRSKRGVTGPLFLGMDTHALSVPACQTALEVLAANGVTVRIAKGGEFTPTPVISHAILGYNRGRSGGLADGIVITPSHNPPKDGGFKYNPVHGGPAEEDVSSWIQNQANVLLRENLKGVLRIPYERACAASTTLIYDFINPFVRDLGAVVDTDLIRASKIKMGVDPLGGAGTRYWEPIADYYGLDLTVTDAQVDPCFRFMNRDWDGVIRTDPSSPYAMKSLIGQAARYDISFACDADHDRHGIVTKDSGLMPSNDYLVAAAFYLFENRPLWPAELRIGKTAVSSQMIDRVAGALKRGVYEVPVGFKWFVEGLLDSRLGFAGEESAGATFLRRDGRVWTTDKDGFAPCLLAAEMTARLGKDPAAIYRELTGSLGKPSYRRIEVPATPAQNQRLSEISARQIGLSELGGDAIGRVSTHAPGNQASIGGIKIETSRGWVALRPSGTEEIYKIYAESFAGEAHLETLLAQAQGIAEAALGRS